MIEVPTSTFPTWQKVESFASTPLKSPFSKEPQFSAEAQPQSLSLLPPALFTKILASPHEIDWASSEFDKASLVAIRDSWNRSIFLAAIEEGRREAIETLLAQNIAVHTVDFHGNNGLALAALNGYSDLVPLLSNHFPINGYNAHKMTPIHQAIKQGHSQVVQALVRNGASLTIGWKSPEGVLFSPAALAVQSGDIPTLEVLIQEDYQKDIDLTQSIAGIGTLVHLAIHTDQTLMLQYLLETQHAFTQRLLEHEDFLGRAPLHLASYIGNLPAIRFLIRQGADIEKPDKENERRPIHFAALGKQP
ncbi:MAG: ankyrin repeat domain-containing protein, partial [Ignavibacteriae bacterium]|nr:ankyrin repeat domain-containing protein [Ignavibacteriota bacterium]